MASENIEKLYPTAEELSIINTNVKCTEMGCTSTFTSESNLRMHIQKRHKKMNLIKLGQKQYHCPDLDCVYHNDKHFDKIKNLKQHYLKVHAVKSFVCDVCKKGFATESSRNNHSEICGIIFNCLECNANYNAYESLITHSRRTNHRILNKSFFITKSPSVNVAIKKDPSIAPKMPASSQVLNIIPIIIQVKNFSLTTSEIGVQTESEVNLKQKGKSSTKRRSTKQTQVSSRKKPRKSAETQTIGDCVLKKTTQEIKTKTNEESSAKTDVKCTETQTKTIFSSDECKESDTKLSGTQTDVYGNLDLNLDFFGNENLMSSGSQINLDNFTFFEDCTLNNSQTQTDLIYQDEFLSGDFNSQIDPANPNCVLDISSNMYTQTCDEALLADLSLNDIQTQTAWPDYDLFVSTETQTLLTHNTRSVLDMAMNAREISHMETQTDMEFKQLLEEKNA